MFSGAFFGRTRSQLVTERAPCFTYNFVSLLRSEPFGRRTAASSTTPGTLYLHNYLRCTENNSERGRVSTREGVANRVERERDKPILTLLMAVGNPVQSQRRKRLFSSPHERIGRICALQQPEFVPAMIFLVPGAQSLTSVALIKQAGEMSTLSPGAGLG